MRDLITAVDMEIIGHVANGKNNSEIAKIMKMSYHTVNAYKVNMFRRVGVKNSAQLVHFAYQRGYLSLSDHHPKMDFAHLMEETLNPNPVRFESEIETMLKIG